MRNSSDCRQNSDSASNLSDSNYVGVDLQITDVKLALTFLDLAETTNVAADSFRRVAEAHKAYTSILHFLARLTPTEEQSLLLSDMLGTLKTRLLAAGVQIS